MSRTEELKLLPGLELTASADPPPGVVEHVPDLDPAHDPGPTVAARRAGGLAPQDESLRAGQARLRVGTAGWTDPTLTRKGVFYPPTAKSSEERLRYYSSRFPLVEIDATYYAFPTPHNAILWAERSGPDFLFDVKAHGLMTGQPTEVNRLPEPIVRDLPADMKTQKRIRGYELSHQLQQRAWDLFLEGVQPLQDAGKLGSILMQYPRWFAPSDGTRGVIAGLRDRLHGARFAVEFRNRDWLEGEQADATWRLLEKERIPLVLVDAPPGLHSSMPALAAVTAPELAVVRFHGRRAATWEKPGAGVADRFRYLYSAAELEEWTPRVLEAASQAQEVHVVFNNCYANYGTTNAAEFINLIREHLGRPFDKETL